MRRRRPERARHCRLAAAPGGYLALLSVPAGRERPHVRPHLGSLRHVPATGGGPLTYRLAVSTDSGLRWSTAITGTTQINPPSPGYAFLGFEDPQAGRWISDTGHIWTTHDGSLHWLRRAFPSLSRRQGESGADPERPADITN